MQIATVITHDQTCTVAVRNGWARPPAPPPPEQALLCSLQVLFSIMPLHAEERSPGPWARARAWRQFSQKKLSRPHDSEEVQIKNLLIFFVTFLLIAFAIPALASRFIAVGFLWALVAVVPTWLALNIGLWHMLITKTPVLAIHCLVYGVAYLCLGFVLLCGGVGRSHGMVSFAYLAPMMVVVLGNSVKQGVCLVIGIVVVTLVILLVELTAGPESLTPQVLTIPPEVAAIFHFIQANFAGSFFFVLLTAVLSQLKEARRALQKKHSREEKLNKTLGKQKQALELEQRLSRKLISNIFPLRVAEALIALFETCGESSDRSASLATQAWDGTTDVADDPGADPQPVGCSYHVVDVEAYSPTGPASIRDELAASLSPRLHPRAVILFADLVGFTAVASQTTPTALVCFLDRYFGDIDMACQAQQVDKVKTIGDGYMCVGWTEHPADHADTALRVLRVADHIHRASHRTLLDGQRLQVRAGVHTGTVVSGIIGKTMFASDVWGDAVNVASRMESTGVPGTTQVSAAVYELLKGHDLGFRPRGPVECKGKGKVQTYMAPVTAPADAGTARSPHAPGECNVVNVLAQFVEGALQA